MIINLEKLFQKNDETYILFLKLSGLFVILASSYLAFYLRNYTNFYSFLIIFDISSTPSQNQFFNSNYYYGTLVHLATYLIVILFSKKEKFYQKGFFSLFDTYYKLIFLSFLIVVLTAIAFKITEQYSRIWFFSNVIISFFISLLLKIYFDSKYEKLIKTNIIQRNVLLVGDLESCDQIAKNFRMNRDISIIKGLVPTNEVKIDRHSSMPLFSLQSDFKKIIDYHHIGQIWIISSPNTFYKIDDLIDQFTVFAIDCRVVTQASKYEYAKDISRSENLSFYDISFSKFYGSGLLIKTFIDKTFSSLALILTFPIILLFSIFIILEDGFPIFFIQKRTGWDARAFNMYKLRSIYKSATADKTKQVKKGDTRVMFIGKIMRRLSIDELPQFYNVLIGDMSVVGPRPHMIEHSEFYSKQILTFLQRHKCPPGITGWAQVNGLRGPTEKPGLMKKRYDYDLYYIKNWSIIFDIYIMIKTVFVIFKHKVD